MRTSSSPRKRPGPLTHTVRSSALSEAIDERHDAVEDDHQLAGAVALAEQHLAGRHRPTFAVGHQRLDLRGAQPGQRAVEVRRLLHGSRRLAASPVESVARRSASPASSVRRITSACRPAVLVHQLQVGLHLHPVADEEAARLQGLVPGHVEVVTVDLGRGQERRTDVAPRILADPAELEIDLDRTGDVADRQLAGHPPPVAAAGREPGDCGRRSAGSARRRGSPGSEGGCRVARRRCRCSPRGSPPRRSSARGPRRRTPCPRTRGTGRAPSRSSCAGRSSWISEWDGSMTHSPGAGTWRPSTVRVAVVVGAAMRNASVAGDHRLAAAVGPPHVTAW